MPNKPLTDSDVANHIDQVKAAVNTLERGRAALLRSDGLPKFSVEEHGEQEFALVSKFDADVTAIQEIGYAQIREAEEAIEALDSFDVHPMSRLEGPELERAGNLLPFIEQDVRQYSARDLAPLVRAACRRDDRALAATWHRAILTRINELNANPSRSTSERTDLAQLASLAESLLDKLRDPRTTQRRAELEKLQDRGRTLVRGVGDELRPIRSAQQQAKLIATGNYGDGVVYERKPPTSTNPVPVDIEVGRTPNVRRSMVEL